MKPSSLLLFLLPCALVNALGQNFTTSFNASTGSLQLSGRSKQILVSNDDWWGVIKAAGDLAADFGKVTGTNLSLSAGDSTTDPAKTYTYRPPTNNTVYTTGTEVTITGPAYNGGSNATTVIIAGTLGSSGVIDSIVSAGKIDVSAIEGQWESYTTSLVHNPIDGVDQALVIAGSTPRGTIYGLYDISEQIGVSPWYYFADVPAKTHDTIFALDTTKVQGPPSIKYRGVFLNDEQPGLTNWVNNNWPPSPYGPAFTHYFHAHLFELLLRLKANYLWPAQWNSMFNVDDYENQPLADAHAVVMGTSHTEPMMRATKEWNTFGSGQWEWDTNNNSIYPFFLYGAQRAAPYLNNSLFTISMRGSGDTALVATTTGAIQVLESVIANQTAIFEEVFSDLNVADIPQLWCLYHEVQGYYEEGLTVPDYVTLLWADDNWGNVRRLPLSNETSRAGGAGVYYHFDFVGDPRDYKWINTIQLQKTAEQMQLAYAYDARQIWIVNVGDLKNLELPINHFLDIAYNVEQWTSDTVSDWTTLWAAREFGDAVAANTTSVMNRYGRYAARRKYELLDPSTYSLINYNEADNVLTEWSTLADDALAIYDTLDKDTQIAFFELVLHPVLAGFTVYQIHIGAAKNQLYALQRRSSANDVAQSVLTDFDEDHNLTNTYHSILGGKWNHIVDQTHLGYQYWQQPMRNTLPPLYYVQTHDESLAGYVGLAVEGLNASVPGDDMFHTLSSNTLTLPPLDPYGPATRWIDVFSRGPKTCTWNLTLSAAWVSASPSAGTVSSGDITPGSGADVNVTTDTRVFISVDWDHAPAAPNYTTVTLTLGSDCAWGNFGAPTVQLPINVTKVPDDFAEGFVESDGHISIEAGHYISSSSSSSSSSTQSRSVFRSTPSLPKRASNATAPYFKILPDYGKTESGVTLYPPRTPSLSVADSSAPYLSYPVYTFSNINASAATGNVTLLLSPSLNFQEDDHALRYAIAVDDETPQVVQFVPDSVPGNQPTGWTEAVADAVWGLKSGNTTVTRHEALKTAGAHEIKIWLLDVGVVLQKVLVDLGGLRSSYLGPPESYRVGA